MADRLPPDDVFTATFGITATIRTPAGLLGTRAVIWLPARASQAVLGGAVALDVMPTLAIRLESGDQVPRGSVVEAPPVGGGPIRSWTVRELDEHDAPWLTVGVVAA